MLFASSFPSLYAAPMLEYVRHGAKGCALIRAIGLNLDLHSPSRAQHQELQNRASIRLRAVVAPDGDAGFMVARRLDHLRGYPGMQPMLALNGYGLCLHSLLS